MIKLLFSGSRKLLPLKKLKLQVFQMTSSFTKMAASSRELRNANRSYTPNFSQLLFYFSARGLLNLVPVGVVEGEVVDFALQKRIANVK